MKNILKMLLITTLSYSHTISVESMDTNNTLINKTFTNSLILATEHNVSHVTFKNSILHDLVIRNGDVNLNFYQCTINDLSIIADEPVTVSVTDSNTTNLKVTSNVTILRRNTLE